MRKHYYVVTARITQEDIVQSLLGKPISTRYENGNSIMHYESFHSGKDAGFLLSCVIRDYEVAESDFWGV